MNHPSLPKFNWSRRSCGDRLFGPGDSVVARWLRPPYDLDGWRIDVANMTGRYGRFDHGHDVARELRPPSTRSGGVGPAREHCHDYSADLIARRLAGGDELRRFHPPVGAS